MRKLNHAFGIFVGVLMALTIGAASADAKPIKVLTVDGVRFIEGDIAFEGQPEATGYVAKFKGSGTVSASISFSDLFILIEGTSTVGAPLPDGGGDDVVELGSLSDVVGTVTSSDLNSNFQSGFVTYSGPITFVGNQDLLGVRGETSSRSIQTVGQLFVTDRPGVDSFVDFSLPSFGGGEFFRPEVSYRVILNIK